jgi:carboxymethylenebutenolidase
MSIAQPDGFLATPASGSGDAVLLLHAWWGLNETMRDFGRRLAGAGFFVFAPDLYHGKVADTIEDAETLAGALDGKYEQALAEVVEAARFLKERSGASRLAVIGFSLGALYALNLAAAAPEDVRSVVLFYGCGGTDFGRLKADVLGHFAENDVYEPQENVEWLEGELKQAGRPVTFYHYPGTGHWFCEPDRPQAYDPAAAELAWERTLAFLQRAEATGAEASGTES